ncbi:MAG: cysteine--tRNA ligase [Candidatus Moraniibacteriota bacterium]
MLKLYNTLTQKKEEFKPLEPGKVKMYNCGPTVYNYAHIGNLRAFVFADILRRYLEYKGYEVRQIMNITDVGHLTDDELNQADSGEDKMLKAAKREKKTPQDIADFYTEKFFEDIESLNLKKAHFYPKATAHISQMIKMIEELLKKGLAYEKNGNVFYDVEKFKDYGKLSKKKLGELKEGSRLEEHPDKKNPYDFALWLKASKEHLMKWESPWSVGYPGWHIECSVMSMEYLGETMDIHTGGEDHIFPHHENEIAQSEGVTGKPFANYWMHERFLLVDKQKMSKSKGNFYTLRDITKKDYPAMAFRILMLSAHYRTNLNFTLPALDQATENLKKIERFLKRLGEIKEEKKSESQNWNIFLQNFEKHMDNDLNTPEALSDLFEMISKANAEMDKNTLNQTDKENLLKNWKKMNQVLGLKFDEINKDEEIDEEIKKMLSEREQARKSKDFKKADEIRNKMTEKGYEIEDTPKGQRVRKI